MKIKICCVSSEAEANLAIACGADALGFVAAMPSGPGVIDEELIARIVATVPPPVATFLLTSLQSAAEIAAQQRRCRTNTIQICDRLDGAGYVRLREALPGVALVQVIHVRDERSVGGSGGDCACGKRAVAGFGKPVVGGEGTGRNGPGA